MRRMAMEALALYCVTYDANRADYDAGPVDFASYVMQTAPPVYSSSDLARYIAHLPAPNSPKLAKPLPHTRSVATQTRQIWRVASQQFATCGVFRARLATFLAICRESHRPSRTRKSPHPLPLQTVPPRRKITAHKE
jgi:hypothetical protein